MAVAVTSAAAAAALPMATKVTNTTCENRDASASRSATVAVPGGRRRGPHQQAGAGPPPSAARFCRPGLVRGVQGACPKAESALDDVRICPVTTAVTGNWPARPPRRGDAMGSRSAAIEVNERQTWVATPRGRRRARKAARGARVARVGAASSRGLRLFVERRRRLRGPDNPFGLHALRLFITSSSTPSRRRRLHAVRDVAICNDTLSDPP